MEVVQLEAVCMLLCDYRFSLLDDKLVLSSVSFSQYLEAMSPGISFGIKGLLV